MFALNTNVFQRDIYLSLLRGFQSYCSLHPDFLIYFVLTLGSYFNFGVFISNLRVLFFLYLLTSVANKSIIQETCRSIIFIVAC